MRRQKQIEPGGEGVLMGLLLGFLIIALGIIVLIMQ